MLYIYYALDVYVVYVITLWVHSQVQWIGADFSLELNLSEIIHLSGA